MFIFRLCRLLPKQECFDYRLNKQIEKTKLLNRHQVEAVAASDGAVVLRYITSTGDLYRNYAGIAKYSKIVEGKKYSFCFCTQCSSKILLLSNSESLIFELIIFACSAIPNIFLSKNSK